MPAFSYKVLGEAVVGSTRTFSTVSNKALTSNVATLTTAASHSLAVGDIVTVYGVDATFDGTHVVATVPSGTTFTYALTSANVTAVVVSPVAVVARTHNLGGVASANKYAVAGICTVTTGVAHGMSVDDWVRVRIGDTAFDGLVQVIAVPSTTTLMFASPSAPPGSTTPAAVASASVATGAVGRAMPSTWTTAYQVPASTSAVISGVDICNETSISARVRVAVDTTASPGRSKMRVYDVLVSANDTVTVGQGWSLESARRILVNANAPEIGFTVSGTEYA